MFLGVTKQKSSLQGSQNIPCGIRAELGRFLSADYFRGVSIAVFNSLKGLKGVQVGAINHVGDEDNLSSFKQDLLEDRASEGVQLGIINSAEFTEGTTLSFRKKLFYDSPTKPQAVGMKRGVMIGALNGYTAFQTREERGSVLEVGGINLAGQICGDSRNYAIQLGIVNYAAEMRCIQFGLINIYENENREKNIIPLLRIRNK